MITAPSAARKKRFLVNSQSPISAIEQAQRLAKLWDRRRQLVVELEGIDKEFDQLRPSSEPPPSTAEDAQQSP